MTSIIPLPPVNGPLIADMQQAQLLMVAGFIMLGWVLARRQIKMRKRVNRDARAANQALKQIREHKDPAVPLCDAPVETQRWQVAMFDLQRELKAELDSRIVIVQTLLRQVDQRIEQLSAANAGHVGSVTNASPDSIVRDSMTRGAMPGGSTAPGSPAIVGVDHPAVERLVLSGHTAKEIAVETGLSIGDVEMAISMIRPK